MASSEDRSLIYTVAGQYYYMGSRDQRASIYNKCKGFVDKLSGYLMQPTDVRFSLIYDATEPDSVLKRAQICEQKLTADYKQTDSDITFAEAVTWSLINGCQILKHLPAGQGFKILPVHPTNFGVLSETTLGLEEQEAFCHVSYPTVTTLRTWLEDAGRDDVDKIIDKITEARQGDRDELEPTYFHQIVVGGSPNPVSAGQTPMAAGIVNVFPTPTPWRPRRRLSQTVRFCELWVHDSERKDWTTIQCVYPDIICEGDLVRRNLSQIPGRTGFVKVQAQATPGYFWGRSIIADVQMLQDVYNKRMRDIKVMWDRNAAAPYAFSGFTSLTDETYTKLVSEGGFVADPNPNAKAQKLVEPPPQGYLEELEFINSLFDEAAGFTPVMSGEGESGVRAGVHAQTLVRTSSPRLIDQASRIERQLAESGYASFRLMQARDPSVYEAADGAIQFLLEQLPDGFQIQVDSHSASPAFREDNMQLAIALARAGAIDSADLIRILHPPDTDTLLANLKQREKARAQAQQQEKQEELMRDIIGLPEHKQQKQARGGR
jgi:hypothetical protein